MITTTITTRYGAQLTPFHTETMTGFHAVHHGRAIDLIVSSEPNDNERYSRALYKQVLQEYRNGLKAAQS